jgi:hypothetical protein
MFGEEWCPLRHINPFRLHRENPDMLQRCTCETDVYPTIPFPATASHMEFHTHDTKGPVRKDRGASVGGVHPIYIDVSDPEEGDSSGADSFDEDDIYDGSDNGDDIIYHFPKLDVHSSVDSMVCPPLLSQSSDCL